MPLRDEFRSIIDNAVKAIHDRLYFAQYPEHPKAYGEEAPGKALEMFNSLLGNKYTDLGQDGAESWVGEERSPYTGKDLGITYPTFSTETLVSRANAAFKTWRNVSPDDRAEVLVDSLEAIKEHFHLIAQATQHTTGQAYMMSFQASGPHSNDRALEALALGYQELTRFPASLIWEKPMGPTSVVLHKQFKPVAKGVGLVIGCSTFPVWNSVPGLYASLITGNPVILKPHPKSVLPIAIVVAEIRKALKAHGYNPDVVQLAVDSSSKLITKELAEHPDVKVIDYTGSSSFGNYIEALPNKVVFTEKAGVNSVILDSVTDLKAVLGNLSFAVSLYSGQMCTAPQNFFIPAGGVQTAEGLVSYEDVVNGFKGAVAGLTGHPKAGPGTLGAIQSDATYERAKNSAKLGGKVLLEGMDIANAEYPEARVYAPSIIEVDAKDADIYEKELFGPIVLIIKTKDTNQSVELAKKMANEHGAITCAAYTTDGAVATHIFEEMESVFTPVSLNLTGNIWVNQHAAFSDFHVTGGNPAGNASFTNPEYVSKRFVWVGHRSIQ
jgi:phenylacetic acid degradation protein paaN